MFPFDDVIMVDWNMSAVAIFAAYEIMLVVFYKQVFQTAMH